MVLDSFKKKEESNEETKTFDCKATIEIPYDKVVFEYCQGNYIKYKEGLQVMKVEGRRSYEDFLEQVFYQYPLNTTKKMIINMITIT